MRAADPVATRISHAVAGADDGLGAQRVGQTEARRKVLQPHAGRNMLAGVEAVRGIAAGEGQRAQVSGNGVGLGRIEPGDEIVSFVNGRPEVPAQADIRGELGGDLIVVLGP